jgi:biopolymer transport protein ExbD
MTQQQPAHVKRILTSAAITTVLFAALNMCYAQTTAQSMATDGAPAKIFLNFDGAGTTADPSELVKSLKESFKNRLEQHAYRFGFERRLDLPESERIERTVFVSAPPATKLGEVIKLIAIVKSTKANPVQIPIEVEPATARRLRLKSDWSIGPTFRPHPLTLVVSLNQPDGFFDKPITGGIDVSLLGPFVSIDGEKVMDKTLVVVNVPRDGIYFMDESSLTKDQLEMAIQNRLKNAPTPDRAVLIKADENIAYFSIAAVAYAAKAAGASWIFLQTSAQKVQWKEQGISVQLSGAWTRDEWNDETTRAWRGMDGAQFKVYLGERLADSVPEGQLQEMHDRWLREKTGNPFEITRFLELNGIKGLLHSTVDDESVSLNWLGFRPAQGKYQYVSIGLEAPRAGFKLRQYELYAILNSIRLADK